MARVLEGHQCRFCGGEFKAPPAERKRGGAKFCSVSCSARSRDKKRKRWIKSKYSCAGDFHQLSDELREE